MGATRQPLRVGIVGCGFVTRHFHLPALRSLADVEVVAVADVDHTALAEVAGRFGIPTRARTAQELIRDARVDAVAVCVPPAAHAEVASLALEAGKHVLVEKPVAASLEDAAFLVERAAQAPGLAMMGFNLRWHRLVREAHGEMRSGRLGTVQCIRSVFSDSVLRRADLPGWRTRRELGGGALLDRAVHHFDLWRWLLGDEIDEVHAASESGQPHDKAVSVVGRTRGGVVTCLTALDASATQHVLEVYGDAGALMLDLYRSDGLEVIGLDELSGAPWRRLRRAGRAATRLLTGDRIGDFAASYREQWRHFADAIHMNSEPACGLDDGYLALEIALAAESAATHGSPAGRGSSR